MGLLPDRPLVRALVIAIAVAVLAGVGLGVFYLVQPPAPPAAPGAEGPVGVTPEDGAPGAPGPTSGGEQLHLPLVSGSQGGGAGTAVPSATPEPSLLATSAAPTETPRPTPTPTPAPTDFEAVREDLAAEGKDLAHVKIGFHAGPGGNARGLGNYLRGLADAGVPAVIKSVDAYGVCAEALQASPEHVTVFRLSGGDLELPNYDLPPEEAAEAHWARVVEALPPEFDKRTWLEVMNEPDKGRADWLGRCAHRLAELALRDGYRLAAFGWSSGEPEREHWQTPGMRSFLTLAAEHPERVAVALHEYSYDVEAIANQYPSLVGRFQMLFQVCDELGIERPTVLITEWGWEAEHVPAVGQAMEDIAWASRLYAAYPQVRGAAIWYLGTGYGGIANQAQQLILPTWYYAWQAYFAVEPGQRPTDPGQFGPR